LTTLPPIVLKYGNLDLLEPSGPVEVCNRIALPLPFTLNNGKPETGHVTKAYVALTSFTPRPLFPEKQTPVPIVGRQTGPRTGRDVSDRR